MLVSYVSSFSLKIALGLPQKTQGGLQDLYLVQKSELCPCKVREKPQKNPSIYQTILVEQLQMDVFVFFFLFSVGR